MRRLIPFLIFLSSCGGAYKVEVTPIQVEVNHTITFGDLLLVFRSECQSDLGPGATEQQIADCANAKLAYLLEKLTQILGG